MGVKASTWKGNKIIAVVGPTGCGKSHMIDCLTSRTQWSSSELQPSQAGVRSIEVEIPHRLGGGSVILVDVPGFDGIKSSPEDALALVRKWLRENYRQDVKLAGILYLHCITDTRVVMQPPVRLLKKLCEGRQENRVIFVTTMWDRVAPIRGNQREGELIGQYWRLMIDAGAQTARFHNTAASAWTILNTLL